jgi:glycosyltransferase involved in cell wall biosynthesis
MVGFLRRGDHVFAPYAHDFDYRVVDWDEGEGFLRGLGRLPRAISGDVVYAFQPALLSLGGALLHRLRERRVPLVLDITDWEVWGMYESAGLRHGLRVARTLLGAGWRAPNSWKYRYLVDKLVPFTDAITVATTFLQRRYGGTIVRPGPDMSVFDPARYDRDALRRKWRLDPAARLIVFTGVPSAWKGIDHLLAAIDMVGAPDLRLVLAGKPMQGHDKLIHVGFVAHELIPELLALADLVVLPQRRHPVAEAQIPTKIFEAMAMAKPIVASAVGDVPEVLRGCGIVVEAESIPALARGIEEALADPEAARALGSRAREKCMHEYAPEAVAGILEGVLRPLVPGAAHETTDQNAPTACAGGGRWA